MQKIGVKLEANLFKQAILAKQIFNKKIFLYLPRVSNCLV